VAKREDPDIAYSVHGVPIRLTYERWFHITENHDELASYFFEVLETIENPEFIVRGNKGALKAAKNMGKRKWVVNKEMIDSYLDLSSRLTKLHVKQFWADYDREADVLYLSFRRPQRAKKTVELDDDVLIRTDDEEVVGVTILNASSKG
jgi:uncharacterized protein YuzE